MKDEYMEELLNLIKKVNNVLEKHTYDLSRITQVIHQQQAQIEYLEYKIKKLTDGKKITWLN